MQLFTNHRSKPPYTLPIKKPTYEAFYYLLKKNISLDQIEALPFAFQIIFLELLREIRNELPAFLLDCPLREQAFYLIEREDMLMNSKLYQEEHCSVQQQSESIESMVKTIVYGNVQDSKHYFKNDKDHKTDILHKEV